MIRIRILLAFAIVMIPLVAVSGENCRDCHAQKGMRGFVDPKTFSDSVHGAFLCTQCHLGIASYPHGRVAKVQCGICHFLGRNGAPKEQALEYKMSVHNRISPVGQNRVPACQTCHGSHDIYPSSDRRSATRREHIPALCSRCHPREFREYRTSIHGIEAIDRNNAKAPTCFDCHQEHMVPPTGDVKWMLSLIKECGGCHSEQLKTYRKTYHGKVTQLGYTTIAKCSDCHGSHRITRLTDSASVLSEQNIVHTCNKCHPGATRGFTRFYAHPDETNRAKYPVMYYTYLFMTTLLIGVFAFFFTHTFLWAYRSLKERMNRKGGG
jgi:hypothetical protein